MNTPREREWKSFPLLGFKAAEGDDAGTFSGYASSWAKDVYGDVIQPGAFAQSITDQKGKIPIFFNHDEDNWIGFSTSLAEDHRGLAINAALALDTQGGADAYALLKAADAIDFRVGLSIGFIAEEWEWDNDSNTRILKSIDLWETSITPFPANKKAFVGGVKSVRDFEKRLRDAGGFSAAESKRILALFAPLLAGGPAVPPSAPARDVREVRSSVVPTPTFRSQLWEHLQQHR
jgi:HK97 family phage prohead protease